MKPQAVVKERVDTRILEKIVVAPAPDRYAATVPDRYAATAAARYASTDRYAAASRYANPDRYAGPGRYAAPAAPGRYTNKGRASRYQAKPGSVLRRRTVIVIPPLRTDGRLVWLTGREYEECFEDLYGEEPNWRIGDRLEFDDAAECRQWQVNDLCMPGEEAEDTALYTITIDNLTETFVSADYYGDYIDESVMAMALALRAQLTQDPGWVVQAMDDTDLRACKSLAGLDHFPTHQEIADAITSQPNVGLGGAALDHMLWLHPELFGHDGVQLQAEIQIACDECYIRLAPLDNFLIYSGSLRPGTVSKPHFGKDIVYKMTGNYVIVKVEYVSDLSGMVIGGWRQCYLEPCGLEQ